MNWSYSRTQQGPTVWQLTGPQWAVGRRSHELRGDDLLVGQQKYRAVGQARTVRRASDSQLLAEPPRYRKASVQPGSYLVPTTTEAVDVDDSSKSAFVSSNVGASENNKSLDHGVENYSVKNSHARKIDEAIPEEAHVTSSSDDVLGEHGFFRRQQALRLRDHRRSVRAERLVNGHLPIPGVQESKEPLIGNSAPEEVPQTHVSHNYSIDLRLRSTPKQPCHVPNPEETFRSLTKKGSAESKVLSGNYDQDERNVLLLSEDADSIQGYPDQAAVMNPVIGNGKEQLVGSEVDQDAAAFETETVREHYSAEHEVYVDKPGYRQLNLGSGPAAATPEAAVPLEVLFASHKQALPQGEVVAAYNDAQRLDVLPSAMSQATSAHLLKSESRTRSTSLYCFDGSVDSVLRNSSTSSPTLSSRSVPSSPTAFDSKRQVTGLINKSRYVLSKLRNSAWSRTDSPEYLSDTSSRSHSPFLISSGSGSHQGSESLSFQEQEYVSYTTIHSLNDQLMFRILSRLSTRDLCRASLACKKWQRLHLLPELWSRIEISCYKQKDLDSVVEFLLRRLVATSPYACLIVKSVKLDRCTALSDAGLFSVARRCPELVALQIPFSESTTGVGLAAVLTNCPNLRFLDASGCPGFASLSFKSESGLSFAENASFLDLRYLDLSDCAALGDSMLSSLLQCCTILEFLYLRRCDNITDNGIESVAAHCRSLKEISLNDCYRVGDRAVKCLSKCCSDLQYVSVAKCLITDNSLDCIAMHLKNLKYLNVHNCDGVTDRGIALIAANCRRLRSLDVGKCRQVTNVSLHALSRNDALKRLSLKDCPRVDDAGLRKLATHSRRLKHLNIQGCNFNFESYVYLRHRCPMCVVEHNKIEFV